MPAWLDNVFSFFDLKSVSLQGINPDFGAMMQIYNPGQPVWSPKNYESFTKEAYKKNATVYTCINKISGAASGIRWRLYTDRTKKKEIKEHPMLDLWQSPNPGQSSGMFVEQLFGYWHIAGNSYIWAYRPKPKTPPLALWHLRPDRVKIVPARSGVECYKYGNQLNYQQTYDAADVLHIKFPAFDNDLYGLSPVEVASQLVDQQNEGNAWNVALMQNAGKPASVFFAKNYLTNEQRNQIRDEIRRKYSGKKNAGYPLVLEADMTWQAMGMAPYELDWLESRELNTREIAAIFDIAPELIGDSAGKTFANVAEARQALYTENVLPKMDRVRDHLNSWLVPMWDDLKGAWFDYDEEDIEALQTLYQAAKSAASERATNMWNSGQCTLAVAQEMQGIEPDPQGDVYKFGAVLVPASKLMEYAEQSLSTPAAPPVPQAEPLDVPAHPQQTTKPVNQQEQTQETAEAIAELVLDMLEEKMGRLARAASTRRVKNQEPMYGRITAITEVDEEIEQLARSYVRLSPMQIAPPDRCRKTTPFDVSNVSTRIKHTPASHEPVGFSTSQTSHTTTSKQRPSKTHYRAFLDQYH
jgi:HK97 family phage portal protein